MSSLHSGMISLGIVAEGYSRFSSPKKKKKNAKGIEGYAGFSFLSRFPIFTGGAREHNSLWRIPLLLFPLRLSLELESDFCLLFSLEDTFRCRALFGSSHRLFCGLPSHHSGLSEPFYLCSRHFSFL